MSDQHLRELEATWRASGSVEDEAAWLLERVRVGDLEQDRLEVAAYCGHEVARLLTLASTPPSDLEEWVSGLRRWGAAPCQLAGLEAARRSLPLWETHVTADARPKEALSLAEDLLLGIGSLEHVEASAEAAYTAAEPYYDAWQPEPAPGVGDAGMAACWAAEAVVAEDLNEILDSALAAVSAAAFALDPKADREAESSGIRAVIGTRVSAWALGYSDPVRERVEARQRGAR